MNITNQTATIVFAALATGIYNTSVQAQPATDELLQQVQQYSNENQNSTNQVTNVNQLRDVFPTDWAYDEL